MMGAYPATNRPSHSSSAESARHVANTARESRHRCHRPPARDCNNDQICAATDLEDWIRLADQLALIVYGASRSTAHDCDCGSYFGVSFSTFLNPRARQQFSCVTVARMGLGLTANDPTVLPPGPPRIFPSATPIWPLGGPHARFR